MSAFFDLPAFFRRISSPNLQRFFSTNPTFQDFDWSTVSPRKIDSLLKRFNSLPPEEREETLRTLREVASLATPAGTQALIEASRQKPGNIPATLSGMRNEHDRALWMFLEHPDLIARSVTLGRLDSLSRRMWTTRHGLPASRLTGIETIKDHLCRQIMDFLQLEQFRGKHCLVEHLQRDGGVECFFAYPSDYSTERDGYDDHGNREYGRRNPWFQIVFAYHSQTGALDIYCPGSRKVKDRLAEIFTSVAFQRDADLHVPDENHFRLDVLKDRQFTFPTHPADRISLVRIQSLRLQPANGKGSGFELHIDARNRNERIYDLADQIYSDGYDTVAGATITSAVLQAFVVMPNGRERSILFRISAPSFCDLEDTPEEQKLRKYLQIWGIEPHAHDLATAA